LLGPGGVQVLYNSSRLIDVLLDSASILLNISKQGLLGRYSSSSSSGSSSGSRSSRQAATAAAAATTLAAALALASRGRARDFEVVDPAPGCKVGLELAGAP
jgi:hypothetical protein